MGLLTFLCFRSTASAMAMGGGLVIASFVTGLVTMRVLTVSLLADPLSTLLVLGNAQPRGLYGMTAPLHVTVSCVPFTIVCVFMLLISQLTPSWHWFGCQGPSDAGR